MLTLQDNEKGARRSIFQISRRGSRLLYSIKQENTIEKRIPTRLQLRKILEEEQYISDMDVSSQSRITNVSLIEGNSLKSYINNIKIKSIKRVIKMEN
ncbi:hypothetical protein KY290_031507 [Solanum tuberosum]|uniref:Uncharacterized protein n=1 Tax=Solanum tuberosum TaxID=4113 RepID=A0ABQ7U9D2_SOLTU|nr:hypothetical protein KY284_030556 [Solanum tuberosum]KAH0655853.1 hypothetical protein KY285_030735 [Solanum tuberosum]KAH0743514.1 hypothetical protein KY290_031507 [Solanum tuberosum]